MLVGWDNLALNAGADLFTNGGSTKKEVDFIDTKGILGDVDWWNVSDKGVLVFWESVRSRRGSGPDRHRISVFPVSIHVVVCYGFEL